MQAEEERSHEQSLYKLQKALSSPRDGLVGIIIELRSSEGLAFTEARAEGGGELGR